MFSKLTIVGALSVSSLAFGSWATLNAQESTDSRVLVQVAPTASDAEKEKPGFAWFQSADADDERVAEDPVVFAADHWLYLLSDADLDERMRNFDRIVQLARSNHEAYEWLEARASDTVDPELSWTAKLALREAKQHGGLRFNQKLGLGGKLRLHGKDFSFEPNRSGSFNLDSLRALGQSGQQGLTTEGKSLIVRSGPDGVHVIVKKMEDGKESTSEFEGENLEALMEAHPELKELMGAGAGGLKLRFSTDPFIDLDGLRLELDHSFDNLMPQGGLRRIFRAIPRDLNLDADLFSESEQPLPGELRTDVLGVYVAQATPEQLEALGRRSDAGIYVEAIAPGTLAELLGIAAGDFLIEINGTELKNADMIGESMRARAQEKDLVIRGIGVDGKEWTRTWSPPVQGSSQR